MTKYQVVKHFGSIEAAAHALGVTGQAIRQWPATLSDGLEAKVVVAVIKSDGVKVASDAFPKSFARSV